MRRLDKFIKNPPAQVKSPTRLSTHAGGKHFTHSDLEPKAPINIRTYVREKLYFISKASLLSLFHFCSLDQM